MVRQEMLRRVLMDAGVRPLWWQVNRVIVRVLVVLRFAGKALVIVGVVAVVVGGNDWVWIAIGGFALFLVAFSGILVLAWVWRRRTDKVRWQDGTVTFRTAEHGQKGQFHGQGFPYVICDVEINATPRVTDEADPNPTTHTARVSWSKSKAWDQTNVKGVVVGATMRCLFDRLDGGFGGPVLRAFPQAGPNAALPSGPEIKFWKEKAK
jgi:hypothetical protein